MRSIYPIIIFFSLCLFSYSQEKINHLDSINKYKHSRPSLALEFGLEYNSLNQNRNPDTHTQEVFSAIGEILSKMGLHANALDYLKRSIKIYQSLPESQRKFPEVDMIPLQLVSGIIAMIVGLLMSPTIFISSKDIFFGFLAGFFQLGFGFIFITIGARSTPSAFVGIIMLTEAVLGPLWAWMFANEYVPLPVLIGGLIVISAVVIQFLERFINKKQTL